MSSCVSVNGRRFEMESLEPFGSVLRPLGGPIEVSQWIAENVQQVLDFMREQLFVVICDADTASSDWEMMPSPRSRHSTHYWHFDGRGQYPLIAWGGATGPRNPTAFVRRPALVEASQEHAHLLDPSRLDVALDGDFVRELAKIFSNLTAASADIRIKLCHSLAVALNMDADLTAFRRRTPKSLIDVMWDSITSFRGPSQEELHKHTAQVRSRVWSAVDSFNDAVTAQLLEQGDVLTHRHSATSDSVALIYNGPDPYQYKSDPEPPAVLAHRHLHLEDFPNEGQLKRLRLRNLGWKYEKNNALDVTAFEFATKAVHRV